MCPVRWQGRLFSVVVRQPLRVEDVRQLCSIIFISRGLLTCVGNHVTHNEISKCIFKSIDASSIDTSMLKHRLRQRVHGLRILSQLLPYCASLVICGAGWWRQGFISWNSVLLIKIAALEWNLDLSPLGRPLKVMYRKTSNIFHNIS